MSKSLSALLSEADELIQTKVASGISKTAAPATTDDDIFSLAAMVRQAPPEHVKQAATSMFGEEVSLRTLEDEFTLTEKIAHSAAIMDVWNNLPAIIRINEFEKAAKAQGYTDDQVTAYIEKNASQFQVRSVFDK